MRTCATLILSGVLGSVSIAPAFAVCGPSSAVLLNGATGEPEKDTVGFTCQPADVGQTGSVASMDSSPIVQVGASTGEAEKDTLGYRPAASPD